MQELCVEDTKLIPGGAYLGGDWKHSQGLFGGELLGGMYGIICLSGVITDGFILQNPVVAVSIVIMGAAIGFANGYSSYVSNYYFLDDNGLYDIQFNIWTGYEFQKI